MFYKEIKLFNIRRCFIIANVFYGSFAKVARNCVTNCAPKDQLIRNGENLFFFIYSRAKPPLQNKIHPAYATDDYFAIINNPPKVFEI